MSDFTLIPTKFRDVTKSDTTPVNTEIGLYIGTGGTVVAKGLDGVQATFTVMDGQYLSGKFMFVMAASTASGIVALS